MGNSLDLFLSISERPSIRFTVMSTKETETIGVHSQEHVWCTDYLFNRHQTIVYENCKSESFPVFCGVPQGSILGPLLFLV